MLYRYFRIEVLTLIAYYANFTSILRDDGGDYCVLLASEGIFTRHIVLHIHTYSYFYELLSMLYKNREISCIK